MPSTWRALVAAAALYATAVVSHVAARGQLPATVFDEQSAPAVAYATQAPHDPVAQLNARLVDGSATLESEPGSGYLRAVLDALAIPVDSQIATFAKASVQAPIISAVNPRVLFFNDAVVVGWPRGGFIEAAAVDPQVGVMFYVMDQRASPPRFTRGVGCVNCHLSSEATLDVPGLLLRSQAALADGRTMRQLGNEVVDHRLPLSKRWGGWYVTGRRIGIETLGNVMVADPSGLESVLPQMLALPSLEGKFDTAGYLSPYSDVAALMVFDHQVRMTNLLARMSWEARAAQGKRDAPALIDAAAREVVDYMLFVDEAPLTGPIEGSSGFAQRFSARGPFDTRGRSLYQLDLKERLLRYPCSYMIYTDAFDALPAAARDAVYRRMYAVLSGQEQAPRYARLAAADRRAIIEILRETRTGIPAYFR